MVEEVSNVNSLLLVWDIVSIFNAMTVGCITSHWDGIFDLSWCLIYIQCWKHVSNFVPFIRARSVFSNSVDHIRCKWDMNSSELRCYTSVVSDLLIVRDTRTWHWRLFRPLPSSHKKYAKRRRLKTSLVLRSRTGHYGMNLGCTYALWIGEFLKNEWLNCYSLPCPSQVERNSNFGQSRLFISESVWVTPLPTAAMSFVKVQRVDDQNHHSETDFHFRKLFGTDCKWNTFIVKYCERIS